MIGQKINSWLVLDHGERSKNGRPQFKCQCKCGTIKLMQGYDIKRTNECKNCQNKAVVFIGQKYGKWSVIDEAPRYRNKYRMFKCQCECGEIANIISRDLISGKSTKCIFCKSVKHGYCNSPIHSTWSGMIQRCTNPNATAYESYGGRGITVYEKWYNFENFLRDMGDRPEGTELDRIDNNGNYEPNNCRWITHKENCQNRRPLTKRERKESN